jgi:hypothetical protein
VKALIDGEGRVFGRMNLFDAALVLFAVLLIPVAYVSFLLFRTPKPHITAVQPAQLTYIEDRAAGGSELRGKLKVLGTGLRPVLRATIGGQNVIAFIFENPTSADVLFGNIPAGTHDLVLYDGVQEVARAPKAVVIPAQAKAALARVRVVGDLIDLDAKAVQALRVGATYPAGGSAESEIVALGDAQPDVREVRLARGAIDVPAPDRWQRPVAIVTECDVAAPLQCRIGNASLGSDGTLLDVPGSGGTLHLRIRELVPADPPTTATVRIRLLAPADGIDLVKAGDRDESAPAEDDRAATILSVEGRQLVQGDVMLPAIDGLQPPATLSSVDRVAAIDATMRLGADAARGGWRYRSQPLSVGRSLTFVTPRYSIRGLVRSIVIPNVPAAERR